MHCPKCGQQQITEETRFCSRCGFLLTGIAQVVANEGIIPNSEVLLPAAKLSPRQRGIRQGFFIVLSAALIVPIITMIAIALTAGPFVPLMSALLLIGGGMLRSIYAFMFESPGETLGTLPSGTELPGANMPSLNAATDLPAGTYAPPQSGMWRDTNELLTEPGSVTDNTTKLLEREARDQ
jgi:hypothetical protein